MTAAACMFNTVSVSAEATSKAGLYRELHDRLNERSSEFSIMIESSDARHELCTDLKNVVASALQIDDADSTDDGEYLDRVLGSLKMRYISADGKEFKFYVEYDEDAEQLRKVKGLVKNTVSGLGLSGKTDYEKVKAVNKWIKDNVVYDYTRDGKTAYDGLLKRSGTVCQGYAMIAYKMLMEAGVKSEIIIGHAVGNSDTGHAWNTVLVDGAWYLLDTCWNDTTNSDKYLLIGSEAADKKYVPDADCVNHVLSITNYKADSLTDTDSSGSTGTGFEPGGSITDESIEGSISRPGGTTTDVWNPGSTGSTGSGSTTGTWGTGSSGTGSTGSGSGSTGSTGSSSGSTGSGGNTSGSTSGSTGSSDGNITIIPGTGSSSAGSESSTSQGGYSSEDGGYVIPDGVSMTDYMRYLETGEWKDVLRRILERGLNR